MLEWKALYMAENEVNRYSQSQSQTPVPAHEGMTIVDLLSILRKHIITIAVTFVVILGVDILYTAMSPVAYTTTTQLFATYNSSNDSANSSEQYSGSSYIMSQIKSYPDLAKTQSVLQPVVDELKLDTTPISLASQITVTNPTNTAFVNIAVTDADPSTAARIANGVAASLSNVVEKSLYTAGSNSAVKLSIVQPAQVPTKQSSPKWSLNILVGVLGGLIIGILAALLKDVLSKKIQDESDVTDIVDAPIIGRVVKDDILAGSSPVVVSEPGSPIAEDFRRIRTNLSFSTPVEGTNCRLVVVTSAGASEGKTTISVNIAAALAHGACDTVVPATDTIVESLDGELISSIPNRSVLYQGQTPQSFNMRELRETLESLTPEESAILTDACKAFVLRGKKVALVRGDVSNIKITYPQDLRVAEAMLEA